MHQWIPGAVRRQRLAGWSCWAAFSALLRGLLAVVSPGWGLMIKWGAFCLVLGNWATLSPALHLSGLSFLSSKAGVVRPHVRAHGQWTESLTFAPTPESCFSSHLCRLRLSLDLPEARSFLEGSTLKQSTVANSPSAKFLD